MQPRVEPLRHQFFRVGARRLARHGHKRIVVLLPVGDAGARQTVVRNHAHEAGPHLRVVNARVEGDEAAYGLRVLEKPVARVRIIERYEWWW